MCKVNHMLNVIRSRQFKRNRRFRKKNTKKNYYFKFYSIQFDLTFANKILQFVEIQNNKGTYRLHISNTQWKCLNN